MVHVSIPALPGVHGYWDAHGCQACMRNCLCAPQKISDEPPFDKDFAAFLELANVRPAWGARLSWCTEAFSGVVVA